MFAGAYLRLGEDFNAAVQACAGTFGSPGTIMNVTSGENAFLVALKENGRVLADEADIVAPRGPRAITDLFLLREALTAAPERTGGRLASRTGTRGPGPRRRQGHAEPEALQALGTPDLIVYGPGTPHSSLLPSYLTPDVADAIAASRAMAKVFVINLGRTTTAGAAPTDLLARTLPLPRRPGQRAAQRHPRCWCHTLRCHSHDDGVPGVSRWVVADVAGPRTPRQAPRRAYRPGAEPHCPDDAVLARVG